MIQLQSNITEDIWKMRGVINLEKAEHEPWGYIQNFSLEKLTTSELCELADHVENS